VLAFVLLIPKKAATRVRLLTPQIKLFIRPKLKEETGPLRSIKAKVPNKKMQSDAAKAVPLI